MSKLRFLPIKPTISARFLGAVLLILTLSLIAAEARRGFSSSGTGSGSYDSGATTNSWDLSATPDADCLAIHSSACADLTAAQIEEVTTYTATAQAANYTNHSDYLTASALGYALTAQDGTQWADAKTPGADNSGTDSAWNSDCNASFVVSGGCDALTATQFGNIDDTVSGRVPAITAGYSNYGDWQTASALGYELASDDAALWTQANNGSVSAAACDAEFPGRDCNQLTKSGFENAKSANALLSAKIAKVTAGTLTQADLLTDLGLSLSASALTSPLAAWQVDYLETLLPTGANTTKTDWQTVLDNYSAASASAWYLWKIASSSATSGTYAAANATTNLFTTAGAAGAVTALGVTNSQIAANIRASGFSAAPSTTAMNDFLTEARGFADGTSYASVSGALGNGWSLSNFLTASGNGGWTQSGTDKTAFDSCLSDTGSATGGASTCQASGAEWTAIAAAIAAAADTGTDISGQQATDILAAISITPHPYFDSSNQVMIDYLNQCISGSSNPADAVGNCVSTGVGGSGGVTESALKQNVTAYKFGRVATTNSGTYASSTVTQTDIVNIGLGSNESTIIGQNYCGTNGTSSCLAVIRAGLGSSSLSATSTPTAIQNWINTTMSGHFQNTVAANQSAPSNPSSSGDACSASNTANTVTMPLIGGCNHSSWTCTFASKSPSSLTLDLADGNVKLAVAGGGPVNNVSYTIRKSLNYSNSGYYKDFSYSLNIPASSNAAPTVQLTTHTGAGNLAITPWNHCLSKGVGWELAESAEVSTALKNAAPNTKVYAKSGTSARTVPVCGGSGWSNNNIVTNWSTWRNHSSTSYRVKYRDANDNLVNGACRTNSGGGANSFWCRNANVYSCN
jgi:hypothetical protein